ncbi:MAG: amidase [Thermodesulfobacteriota bacterium]|nr:amidase [Thermodesulfobacteriota bacterium]
MSEFKELAFLDALSQAELVRRKEVQPIELVEAAIERIERVNPTLNAITTTIYDQAREAAKGDLPDGPFAGVPFLLKDMLAACKGLRMTLGSNLLRDYVPNRDSEIVKRIKRSGLIILGRTNVPEFGLLPTTEPELFGPCRNPWNTQRTPGGSSGGSASAVAAGLVPMAHGSDGGGSIRIPASCCGLFGLKLTRARNPLGPDFGEIWGGLVAEHALTRTVRDSAALLDVTAGPDVGDPYWAPPPKRPFLEEVGADPGKLRIAFTAEADVKIHEDCVKAVHEAAELCSSLGHEVEEAAPRLDINTRQIKQAYAVIVAAGTASTLKVLSATKDQVGPLGWALYEMANKIDAADYILAIQTFQRVARSIARSFVDFDVYLTPVLAEPPVPIGTFDSPPDNPLDGFIRAADFIPFTPFCNFTGQPAMSLPLFWNDDNLPIGTQFAGRFGDEATLFRLAAQLEAARPWAHRHPPVSA